MRNFFSFFIIALFVLTLSGCSRDTKDSIEPQATQFFQEESENNEIASELPYYSLNTIAEHNTRNDCWTLIDGAIVDLTGFFDKHPGGEMNLEKACGIDATTLFTSVKQHDPNGYQKLKELQIGVLGSEEISTEEPEGN